MWEEHPEYQKAQARAIGVLVVGIFVASLIYALVRHDRELLRLVLAAAAALAIVLLLLPLILKLVIKTITRLWKTRAKNSSSHDDT